VVAVNGVGQPFQGFAAGNPALFSAAGGSVGENQPENQGLIDLDGALLPLPTTNGNGNPNNRTIGGDYPTPSGTAQVDSWDGVWGRQDGREDEREDELEMMDLVSER